MSHNYPWMCILSYCKKFKKFHLFQPHVGVFWESLARKCYLFSPLLPLFPFFLSLLSFLLLSSLLLSPLLSFLSLFFITTVLSSSLALISGITSGGSWDHTTDQILVGRPVLQHFNSHWSSSRVEWFLFILPLYEQPGRFSSTSERLNNTPLKWE